MIEENRKEFEKCNIIEYHNAGIMGENVTIVVLDDNKKPLPFMDYCEYPLGWFEKTKQHHSTKVVRVIHEVAPNARIISLPYINEATTQMKNDSIQWILDNKDDIDIINCSFHEWKNGLITKLEKLDIPVVCASGNDGEDNKISYPAKHLWTIAIGGLEEYRDKTASYSNSGEELDCLGYTNIKIPCTKGIMDFGGTSCATPFVAGMLALLMCAKDKNFTGQEAKEIIKNNCIDYYEKGKDFKSGYGLMVLPKLEELNMVKKIGTDFGHGFPDPGAIGSNGLQEKDVNLNVGLKLNELLSDNGFTVVSTRVEDKFVELVDRTKILNNAKCDIAISIHVNSSTSKSANYISTFIQGKGGRAEILANHVQKQLVETTKWSDGGVRVQNLHMTRETNMPTALVELGFISNLEQEKWLFNKDNQDKLAVAICKGVCEYYGMEYKELKEEEQMAGYIGYKIESEIPIILDGQEIKLKALKIETPEGGVTMLPIRDFLQDIIRDKYGIDLQVGYDGRVLLNKIK